MSLFGTSPPDESPSMHSSFARSRASLFDDDDSMTASQTQSASNSLFQDDGSPWDMPAPRRQKSRADLLRGLLPAADAPDSYIETFDAVVREEGSGGKVSFSGLSRVLAAARLDADAQAHIAGIVAPAGSETALGRNEFNVLLALVGLAQEGETVSLDSVDERRRSEFLLGFLCRSMHTARPVSLRIPQSPSPQSAYAPHPPVPQQPSALYLISQPQPQPVQRWRRVCPVAVLAIGQDIVHPLKPKELLWGLS